MCESNKTHQDGCKIQLLLNLGYLWDVFVRLTWCSTKKSLSLHVFVHCKVLKFCSSKVPHPALNAYVRNHCDHRDKERKCFPWPFLCLSQHPFSDDVIICISSYLLNTDYTIVLSLYTDVCLSEVAAGLSFDGPSTHALTLTHSSKPEMCSSLIVSSRHIYRKCVHHIVIYLICVFSNE